MRKSFIMISIIIFIAWGCGGQKEISPSDQAQHSRESEHIHTQAGPQSQEEEAKENLEDDGHIHPELHLSPEKQKEWGIELGEVSTQNITSEISLPGVVTLNQNRTAHLSSFVEGKIVTLSADLGNHVKKNQILVTINSPEFAQAQAEFLRARAKWNLSRKEYERAEMLLKEKAIEEKEYLRREAEHEKLTTEYAASGSALHSYGLDHDQIDELIKKCEEVQDKEYKCEIADPHLSIRSPVEGTVIFRDVIVGEHIAPAKILYTVSALDTLWAVLDAYEQDLPFISKSSEITITAPLYPDEKFSGDITYISDTIDEKLRTVKIRVEVKNRKGLLKPNMYIQGLIKSKSKEENILVLPEEAIQNLNGEKVAFVLDEEDGAFTVRHIKPGRKIGPNRVILSGLNPGEKVVFKGAFYLKAEISKKDIGQKHVH